MALTFAQIVSLALQISKTGGTSGGANTGFTTQAGLMFNAILEELSQTYDFDSAQRFFTFNFNTGVMPTGAYANLLQPGSGPYPMPADFLRALRDDVFWTLQGVPYPMIALDQNEFDMTVQQPGNQNYPYWYTIDMSATPPNMYVYMAPSGDYPVYVRYYGQPTDATNPQNLTTTPWFPNSTYLYTRLAGELMKISGDDRWQAFLGKGPEGAQGMLERYLKLVNDNETRSKRVTFDRRRFGSQFSTLNNTKTVGW